jgi:hypothetical protein
LQGHFARSGGGQHDGHVEGGEGAGGCAGAASCTPSLYSSVIITARFELDQMD